MADRKCCRCGKPINRYGLCDECKKWLDDYCKSQSDEMISRRAVLDILRKNNQFVWDWAEQIMDLPILKGVQDEHFLRL